MFICLEVSASMNVEKLKLDTFAASFGLVSRVIIVAELLLLVLLLR